MIAKKPLHPEFIRWVLAGEGIYQLQKRFGVARSVIERWRALPEVVEVLRAHGMAPEAPADDPHRSQERPSALAVVPSPESPAPAEPPKRPPAAPSGRDPSEAAAALQSGAADYAESILSTLADIMESEDAPPAARIVAADKLAGYLPAAPKPRRDPLPIPKTAVEFYEWMFLEIREQFRSNASNPAAQMAAARRLESAWSALKDARAAENKSSGNFASQMAAIVDMCRAKPISVVDEIIARLTAVREERAPTATA